jgi:hypothetical protein
MPLSAKTSEGAKVLIGNYNFQRLNALLRGAMLKEQEGSSHR